MISRLLSEIRIISLALSSARYCRAMLPESESRTARDAQSFESAAAMAASLSFRFLPQKSSSQDAAAAIFAVREVWLLPLVELTVRPRE